MYGLFDYGRMIADQGRTRAYADSLKRYVTPASVVLDIGTGTGIFALLAAHLGARKVYAIDSSGALELGRRVAAQNDLDGRIEFIHGLSTEIHLPEKVDVIVAEIHGILPTHQRSIFSIIDARDRFLASDGHLIPRRERVWAALAEVATLHDAIVGVWGKDVYGIDMTPVESTAVNTWRKSRLGPRDLVTSPQCCAVLDYAVLRSPHLRGDVVWEIVDDRAAHGISVWFDWESAEGVAFSNSPLSGERHIFGQAFFPWPEAVPLCRGDEVSVQLRADAVGSDYVYGWHTTVQGKDGRTKTTFQQSDFFGQVLASADLRKISAARSKPDEAPA